MFVIDSHAHLSSKPFDHDRREVVARARDAGVTFLEVGADLASAQKVLNTAREFGVPCTLGLHPHNAKDEPGYKEAWRRIEILVDDNPDVVVAIGEIGLDYFRNISPKGMQIESFEMGLDLAKRKRLPVVIHERDARDDTISVIRNADLWQSIVLHCFHGDLDSARQYLDLDAYLGIGGILTYPRNHVFRDAVRYIPESRILMETDCPYLPPQGRRGERNEPHFILEVLEVLSLATGKSPEDIARSALSNTMQVFRVTENPIYPAWNIKEK
jgi:TatD DNase family protein